MHLLILCFFRSILLTYNHLELDIFVRCRDDPILIQDMKDTQMAYNLLCNNSELTNLEIVDHLPFLDVYKIKKQKELIAYLEAQRTTYIKKQNWFFSLFCKKKASMLFGFIHTGPKMLRMKLILMNNLLLKY